MDEIAGASEPRDLTYWFAGYRSNLSSLRTTSPVSGSNSLISSTVSPKNSILSPCSM